MHLIGAWYLRTFLIKNQKKNKSNAYLKPHTGALKAVLNYKTLKHLDRYTLLEINPISGRHHQIRVQLSTINSVIKGDLKYGAKRSNRDASICLHSREINFVHQKKNYKVITTSKINLGSLFIAPLYLVL